MPLSTFSKCFMLINPCTCVTHHMHDSPRACPHHLYSFTTCMPSPPACPHHLHALTTCMPSPTVFPHHQHAPTTCMPSPPAFSKFTMCPTTNINLEFSQHVFIIRAQKHKLALKNILLMIDELLRRHSHLPQQVAYNIIWEEFCIHNTRHTSIKTQTRF